MALPTIYYIRHGETDWNAAGRFQGSQDIPLNGRGRGQATEAGAVLARLLADAGLAPDGLPFLASPLGRTRHTMELVRQALGLPAQGYGQDARLREIAYGRWEGSTLPQMQASDPDVFAARQRDGWGVAAPEGESYADLTRRVGAWHEGLPGDCVVVAHGGTMRALLVARGHETPATVLQRPISQGTVYVFGPGGCTEHGAAPR
jgi:probable phosphoglycerate mutase